MAAGSNIFIATLRPKLTTAAPATQRQRRDNSRPFGKTNATATGQANSSGMVARADWSDHPAPKSCSALSWTDGTNDPSRSIQAMRLRGNWSAISRPTTVGASSASARNG